MRKLNLDASELENAELSLSLDGLLFDAPTSLTAHVADLNASNRLQVQTDISGLTLERIWKYLNLSVPVAGTVDRLSLTFAGEPAKPSGWSGQVNVRLSAAVFDQQPLGDITLNIELAEKRAKAALVARLDPENHIDLNVDSTLPETLDDFDQVAANGRLQIFTPDLVALKLPLDVIGDLTANIDFELGNKELNAEILLDSSSLALAGAELTETHLRAHLSKKLDGQPNAPFFARLTSDLESDIKRLRLQNYIVDSVNLALSTKEEQVQLKHLAFSKGANRANLQANYALPADLSSWDRQPLDFEVAVDAPDLQAFVVPDSGATLKGTLKITGKGGSRDRIYNGNFVIEGRGIEVQGVTVRSIYARLEAADNQAKLSQLEVVFDDKNAIHGGAAFASANRSITTARWMFNSQISQSFSLS